MNESDRQVARFVDGEMSRDEGVAFDAALRADPALRAAVEDVRRLRQWFAPGRCEAEPTASPEFHQRLLAAVATTAAEQVSVRPGQDDAAASVEASVERIARRVIAAAAAIIVAVTLAFAAWFGRAPGDGRLEAAPDDVQHAMSELDARIRDAAARDTPLWDGR